MGTQSPESFTPSQDSNSVSIPSVEALRPARPGALRTAPLSFAQERLWFLQQLDPESYAYNLDMVLRLKGTLDQVALRQALRAIVQRHQSLRTRYLNTGEQPIQEIWPADEIALPVIELGNIRKDRQEAALETLLQELATRPFDLSSDQMLRATLVRLGEHDHVLQMTMHHIASDGWSMNILSQELLDYYKVFAHGEPDSLPQLPIQYADFAEEQRQRLQGETLERHLAYARDLLEGIVSLDLPTDSPRLDAVRPLGQAHAISLSRSQTERLQELTGEQGTSLFAGLLAAFKLLLARLCGQDDIVVGAPFACRHQPEVESLVGLFVDTVVLRTRAVGGSSFRSLLDQLRNGVFDAFDHQDLPFEKLVEEVRPKRDHRRPPLFQVWFNMFTLEQKSFELPGLKAEWVEGYTDLFSKFDLTVYASVQQGVIHVKLVSNPDMFCAERAEALLQQYEHLLAQILEDPDCSTEGYTLVTPQARALLPDPRQVISEPILLPVPVLVSRCAGEQPSQIAITQGDQAWTYEQLVTASDGLAFCLLENGLQPGDVVAVTGCRSFGLIASLLGALRSGGVLLPLDPALPSARHEVMLNAAQARFLLIVGEDTEVFNESCGHLTRLRVGSKSGRLILSEVQVTRPAQPELPVLLSDASAYIFFTSGTTGIPKGVLGTHKGLAHFLDWQKREFAISNRDRVAQLTRLSFDVVLRDVFLALVSGATLCLPAHDEEDPPRIFAWLIAQRISLLHIVPTLARIWLLEGLANHSLPDLRLTFFAGEPLTGDLVQPWRQVLAAGSRIVNLYGPTEATLAQCFHVVEPFLRSGVQPVGKPLPDTQALVLTGSHRLCGVGEPGELVIRTPFLTRGYINAQEEQARRFQPNPYREDRYDILYFTGDRGRYRPDGVLQILGREDQQIKLRGIRIEPGEIESKLREHPVVDHCVVVAREIEPGDMRLVAYLVCAGESTPDFKELRQFLRSSLPDSMVPSAFVGLDRIPLTANKKVDYRALPAPGGQDDLNDGPDSGPADDLEVELIRIWEHVLKVQPIRMQDDFFELGGHSLLAVRLFSEIEKVFGKKLPLATLFQATKVQDFANIIRRQDWLAPWLSLVPLVTTGSKEPLFYLHAGGGNLLVYRDLVNGLDADRPMYGLQPRGLDRRFNPFKTIEDMADHYLAQITQRQPVGPYYLAGLSSGGLIALEIAQRLQTKGQRVAFLAMFDTIGDRTYEPKKPLIRLASVLSWFIKDRARAYVQSLRKSIRVIRRDGLKSSFSASVRATGPAGTAVDGEQEIQKRKSRSAIQLRISEYESSAGGGFWTLVDSVLISLLNHSSKPYYAGMFARGLTDKPDMDLPEELQVVQAANRAASQAYVPKPYSGDITYFKAHEFPPGVRMASQAGWGYIAGGKLEIVMIPGNHTSIMKSAALEAKLRECLELAH